MKQINISATDKTIWKVNKEMLASSVGSGATDVFATPMMIALMENSAFKCLNQFLDEGETSVGTQISTTHISATPIGMEVYAISTITSADGRKVDFKIEAYDACGKIGEATHSRFVVNNEKFILKTNEKLNV